MFVDGGVPGSGTAVVLGSGGPVGHAYHSGVLAALHDRWAFDVRNADLIVGTSAGAGIGALVRASLSGPDLLARVTGQPLCERVSSVARCFRRPQRPTRGDKRARTWRPAAASYLLHAVRRPWAVRPGPFAAALLPAGSGQLADYAAGLSELFPQGWPEGLWITALRVRDGQVVIFGRDGAPEIDVGTAVACSSAVPTVWRPMMVGGEAYVDGGMSSALHMPLVVTEARIQRVIVSSPLSRMPLMSRLMRAEVRALERAGIDVLTFEPGPAVSEAMGWNPMDHERAPTVALAAYRETLETLDRIRVLKTRSAPSVLRPSNQKVNVA